MYLWPKLLLLCVWLYTTPCVSLDEVVSIEIGVADYDGSNSNAPIQITLWFNLKIYQRTFIPETIGVTYSIDVFDVVGCNLDHIRDTKIMVKNPANRAVIIDTFVIHTTSGEWYGIMGRCFDALLDKTQRWLLETKYQSFITSESLCASEISNIWMCIDMDSDDCAPYKQIFYFDTTKANAFIYNAVWSDGSDVVPQITSCAPTITPTQDPTNHPTVSPTINPSSANPTQEPTVHPSLMTPNPTDHPTNNPTNAPTLNPTLHPSHHPTAYPPRIVIWQMPSFTPASTDTPSPTEAESEVTVHIDHRSTSEKDKEEQSRINVSFLGNPLHIWLIIGFIGCAFINCLCVLICCIAKKRQKQDTRDTANATNAMNMRSDMDLVPIISNSAHHNILSEEEIPENEKPDIEDTEQKANDEGQPAMELYDIIISPRSVEPAAALMNGDDSEDVLSMEWKFRKDNNHLSEPQFADGMDDISEEELRDDKDESDEIATTRKEGDLDENPEKEGANVTI